MQKNDAAKEAGIKSLIIIGDLINKAECFRYNRMIKKHAVNDYSVMI